MKKGRFAKLLILFSTVGLLLLVFCGNLVVFANGVGSNYTEIPVGGDVYPVSMLDILAPWLGLAGLLVVAISIIVLIRRRNMA